MSGLIRRGSLSLSHIVTIVQRSRRLEVMTLIMGMGGGQRQSLAALASICYWSVCSSALLVLENEYLGERARL